MRFKRGVVASIALVGTLVVASCAKDSDDGGDQGQSGDGSAQGCETVEPPDVEVAEETDEESQADPVDASALKVGLAYDIGGRGDASFNDSAAAGLDQAKAEMGVEEGNVKELAAEGEESEAAKQTRLRQLANEGHDPVIAVGFAYSDATAIVARENPNVDFAVVDGFVEDAPKNVTFLSFAEHEGSFLVGVIAALKSETCTVGFVGGVNNTLINKFEAGFVQGVEAVAPDAEIISNYITETELSGFTDPAKGEQTANGQIQEGADVLYHAAGASGKGVFAAAFNEDVMAIGVDSDQYEQETVAEYKDVIISSMLKRVDTAVYDYLAAVAEDDLSGLPAVFDLKADGVGYSTSGGKIDDITETVDKYKQEIVDGNITVEDSVE